ncbi:hypothetical protein Dimus_032976 [Dionaea muscipula]
MDHPCSMRDGDSEHVGVLRLNHMCQVLTKVASRVKSKEAYDLVMETAKRLSIQVEALNVPNTAGVNVEELANQQQVEEPINAGNVPQVMLLDPNLSQTKGRKRDGKGKELRMMKRTYRVELFFYMLFWQWHWEYATNGNVLFCIHVAE